MDQRSTRKVAIVTGANNIDGIGFAAVKLLCQNFDGDVILTSRDMERGRLAVAELTRQGYHTVRLQQLDLITPASIQRLHDHVLEQYGGLDILVNNASSSKGNNPDTVLEDLETNVHTIVLGTLSVCNTFFPILRNSARVVHLSSRGAVRYAKQLPENNRRQLMGDTHSLEQLSALMLSIISDVRLSSPTAADWSPHNSYGLSKAGLIRMAAIQQAMLDSTPDRGIIVNACCPGFIQTKMGANAKHRPDYAKTPEEGADVVLYLSLLPEGATEPKGKFLGERSVIAL